MSNYTKTLWVDDTTPVSATNMNKIEQGVYDAHTELSTHAGASNPHSGSAPLASPNFTGTPKVSNNNVWHEGTAPKSLAANGYQKLPSGLIIQWATIAISAVQFTWTYPIAFPTGAMFAAGTVLDPNRGADYSDKCVVCVGLNPGGALFNITKNGAAFTPLDSTASVTLFAVGY